MVVDSSLDPDGDIDSHHIRNLQEKKNVLININLKSKIMFNQYFVDVLRNKYADFNGRARRSEYWYFVLFNFLIGTAVGVVTGLIGIDWLSYIYSVALLVPGIAVGVRRLHDIGKSGWWLLISFIPLIGGIWLIILMAKEGDHGNNAFGPDPKA